jgi:hypothetical protein
VAAEEQGNGSLNNQDAKAQSFNRGKKQGRGMFAAKERKAEPGCRVQTLRSKAWVDNWFIRRICLKQQKVKTTKARW